MSWGQFSWKWMSCNNKVAAHALVITNACAATLLLHDIHFQENWPQLIHGKTNDAKIILFITTIIKLQNHLSFL